MSADNKPSPREELEAQVTALLLGELPPHEAASLRKAIAHDAKLKKLCERLKVAVDLVGGAVASPAEEAAPQSELLRLSEERREKLLAHFKTVRPKEFASRRTPSWLVPLAAAAAVVATLFVTIALPNFTKARSKSQANSIISDLRQLDAAKQMWAVDNGKGPDAVPTLEEITQYMRNGNVVTATLSGGPDVAYTLGPVRGPVTAQFDATQAKKLLGANAQPGQGVVVSSDGRMASVLAQGTAQSSAQRPTVTFANDSTRPATAASVNQPPKASPSAIVLPPAEKPPLAPVELALHGQFTGDPEWIGQLERPAPSREGANRFQSRYAHIVTTNALLDLAIEPRPPVVFGTGTSTPSKGGPEGTSAFLYHLGLSTSKYDTNGSDLSGSRAFKDWALPADAATGLPSLNSFGEAELSKASPTGEATRPYNVTKSRSANPNPAALDAIVLPSEGEGRRKAGEANNQLALNAGLRGVYDDTAPALGDVPAPGKPFRSEAKTKSESDGEMAFAPPDSRTGYYSSADIYRQDQGALLPGRTNGSTYDPSTTYRTLSQLGVETNSGSSGLNLNYFALRSPTSQPSTPLSTPAVSPLRQELAKQDEKIARAQATVDQLRDQLKIPDAMASGDAPSMLLTAETLRHIEGLRSESQAEYLRQRTLVEKLKSLPPEQLPQAIPAAVQDTWLSSLLEQKTQTEQKLASLNKNGGVNSTEAQEASTRIKDLDAKIKDRADGILMSLDARVASLEAGVVNLSNEVAKAEEEDLGRAQQNRPYFEAKHNLEELVKFRQVLYMKMASERTDMELPKLSVVDIVDKAVPASAPSPTLWERITGGGSYVSKARIKVERDESDIQSLQAPAKGIYDPYFVQTELETIQSQAILSKVAKELNLKDAWSKKNGGKPLTEQETVALLKQKLDLRPVPNTSLLEIGAKSDQADEAARIANSVAAAYQRHRVEQRKELSLGGIKALDQAFNEQGEKIAQAQKEVDRLREELHIPAAVASADAPSLVAKNEIADRALARPAAPAPIPQPEVQTRNNAFSTFSLNVSDVSFKLAAASLEKGLMPEPASIRTEEFINAFDYRDPEPAAGAPLAFAWERARYPFAHNRDLLRFSIKTAAQGRQAGRPLNLVLLLDNSGSMERADRVRIIREALRVLAAQLHPQDKFSVVTFARTPRLWVDGVPGDQAAKVAEEVSSLTPQGGTNLEEAMNLAYQTALRHYLANGLNRVVLLTDGAANLGNVEPTVLKQKVEANRKQGIALDCFGIGWEGYNDDLLEVLTRNGDGRYGFINTPEEAATGFAAQLAGALHVAASDVKVQVEFNPNRVTAYRQLGYAKHQLTKEQFRDNTVDAAELAAAESGNALYVIESNPTGDGPLATVRVRYKAPGTSDYREQEWAMPYTGSAVALEQASSAMRLAGTASAFSEWLAGSPYAAEVTTDGLLGYVRGVPEVYGADGRPKKLEWMIRQAKSVAGK